MTPLPHKEVERVGPNALGIFSITLLAQLHFRRQVGPCELDRNHQPLASVAGIRASRRTLAARAPTGRVVDGLRKGAGG
jgi:hypothetical protein